MDFPHLKDTNFPIIDNVNVYKYQNNFDYARWEGKVSFKLLNVLWNSNYSDVPYFETDEERDNWFDAKDGYVGALETLFNNTPTNTIKIPIPYNDAYKYNYLVVDMPIQTSVENPINFEDASIRVKRWFYFIEDMTQFSPNTTELSITVDYWTTFIHTVDIPYLMLERGHAPMMQTNVDEYLANPIMNNEYLLADDFNYGNDTVIQTSNYYPIGNGQKYVLFCAPYSREAFDRFGGVKYSGNSTPPTYSDINNRWGYQLQVNDYEWKYGNTDYSNAQLPIYNMIQTGLLNGCECFAIEGKYAREFFNDCAHNCVQFIHGIQAMFILDESLFVRSNEFMFRGFKLYIADRKINNVDIRLTKEQFGFDEQYKEITKLYTFPYSSLEVTDDFGNVFSARVENCGNLKMHEEVSLMYPFLNYNVFFSGINGNGEMRYKWVNIQDGKYTDTNCTMWADDFSKFMMNWEVPVYSIYVSSEYEYAVNNFFNNKAKRAGAIKDYENAVRYANTTRENVADSMQTNTNNVAASGATNTGNTIRNTNTMVANVNADMQTLLDNTETACNTATDTVTRIHNPIAEQVIKRNNEKIEADAATANYVTIHTLAEENELAAISYGNSSAANLASGLIGAAGSMVGGAFGGSMSGTVADAQGGGLGGAVSGGISGVVSLAQQLPQVYATGANLLASISTSQDVADITTDATTAYADYATTLNEQVLRLQQREAAQTTENNNDSITEQNERTSNTNKADANRSKNAADANASDLQATNNANATRTQNTETANATYNRNANVVAEKANLVQKQLEADYQYRNARLHAPATYSDYSGTFAQDALKRRGVRFNVRTQPKSVIAQTGDAMLRFGYALHRVWDMKKGFHYGKHFTFWKAEDIWINDGNGVANTATNTIGQILLKGVTIWQNPDEIGMIGIYDNI